MVEPLPTFEQVLELMRLPKPPIACRVVEFDGRTARRTAAVLFDGLQAGTSTTGLGSRSAAQMNPYCSIRGATFSELASAWAVCTPMAG